MANRYQKVSAIRTDMASINIERNNHKVQGHNGDGRYDLIGSVNSFRRLTEHQAAEKIGESILFALRKYCEHEGVDMIRGGYGVKLSIEFEKYERKDYGK